VAPGGSDMLVAMQDVAGKLRDKGKKPYSIPGGASDEIGALGYVACAQEILIQSFEQDTSIMLCAPAAAPELMLV